MLTYSVYCRRPSPVESKNLTKWRQHMSLTLSIPLSLFNKNTNITLVR